MREFSVVILEDGGRDYVAVAPKLLNTIRKVIARMKLLEMFYASCVVCTQVLVYLIALCMVTWGPCEGKNVFVFYFICPYEQIRS